MTYKNFVPFLAHLYKALRSSVKLTFLNRQHLCRPRLLTCRVTGTLGRLRHSTCSVSCNICSVHFTINLNNYYSYKSSVN